MMEVLYARGRRTLSSKKLRLGYFLVRVWTLILSTWKDRAERAQLGHSLGRDVSFDLGGIVGEMYEGDKG